MAKLETAQQQIMELLPPWENGYVESFNSRFRDELLNEEFEDLTEARWYIDRWRVAYKTARPHSSLDYQTPARVRGAVTDPSVVLSITPAALGFVGR